MSGALNGPTAPATPLLSSEQASKLLDGVVYERVVACIDLDGLYQLEQELWSALDECGLSDDDIGRVASELVGSALARVRDDPRRWASFGTDALDDDCPLCVDVAREEAEAAAARHRKARKPRDG